MFGLRNRLKGARFAPFSFVLLLLTIAPTEVGYQDIGALIARQPGVASRWQQHVFASARSTLQVASFNFVRPVGTYVPQTASYQLASLDSQGIDVTGALGNNPLGQPTRSLSAADFPVVDRTLKGDRLTVAASSPSEDAPTKSIEPGPNVNGAKSADVAAPLDAELQAALDAPHLPQYEAAGAVQGKAEAALASLQMPETSVVSQPSQDPFSVKTSSLFFGNSSLGESEALERWEPGEGPVLVTPNADPDLKQLAALPPAIAEQAPSGETIANKGEVNGANTQAKSPAERLSLDAKGREKGEKCLAEAVYFEARGEAVRGQIAVAQVVMNRVFSGFYPNTICGVVYQNKHRHLACQFTFACDNVRDVISEPEMWERAKKIAKATLDGQLWLPEVGKSTHYHAYWVRPSWVNEMKKMYRFGVHTFYRPRAWGDGHDAPSWGNATQTAQISAQLAEAAKSSAEMGVEVRR